MGYSIDSRRKDQEEKREREQNRRDAGIHSPKYHSSGTVDQFINVSYANALKEQAKKEKSIMYRIKRFFKLIK